MSGVELTLFRKHPSGPNSGPLSKKIWLDGDAIVADGSACVMSRGEARRLPITSTDALAQTIAGLSSLEAIALGRLRAGLPGKVTVVTQRKLNGQADTIARTGEFIHYDQGRAGYALVDFDRKGMPTEVAARITAAGGAWPALCTICPGLAGAARAGVAAPRCPASCSTPDRGALPRQRRRTYLRRGRRCRRR